MNKENKELTAWRMEERPIIKKNLDDRSYLNGNSKNNGCLQVHKFGDFIKIWFFSLAIYIPYLTMKAWSPAVLEKWMRMTCSDILAVLCYMSKAAP